MHQFYNPELSPAEVDALDWANWLVVQSTQAFLGAISDNVLGIAIEPRPNAVTIHVTLREPSETDDEAIDDALSYLDVLLEGRTAIDRSIVASPLSAGAWLAAGLRLLFLRRSD